MSKFKETFNEVIWFTAGLLVLDREIPKEKAAEMFGNYFGAEIEPGELREDRVRFGFPSYDVDGAEDLGSCWHTGASGQGSKPVWVFGRERWATDLV